MYLISRTTKVADMTAEIFGPGFSEQQAKEASYMETWGTGFTDPGQDFVEFRLLDSKGSILNKRRESGY